MSHGPVLLAQAGRDGLTNYTFILEAPWKACRLCGTVFQSDLDRLCYKQQQNGLVPQCYATEKEATARREDWLKVHNKRFHPRFHTEVKQLADSGLPVTPEAAHKLSTYGIIPMGPTPYEDEVADALFSAPRAPVNDVDGT